jgi:hypothetical protein
MLTLKLDPKSRKFIEIPIENEKGEVIETLKYFERNTKQIKSVKKASKDKTILEVDDLNQKIFFENLKGSKETIEKINAYYEENGNIVDFINDCDEAMGKLKKRG